MTADEAANLKPGDRVEVQRYSQWVPAVVERVRFPCGDDWPLVRVRRTDIKGAYEHTAYGIRYPVDLPARPANVFADWLDDHGEHSAAAKLRAAFPLYPAEGVA